MGWGEWGGWVREGWGGGRGTITCSGVASSLLVMFIDAAISSKSRKPVGGTFGHIWAQPREQQAASGEQARS